MKWTKRASRSLTECYLSDPYYVKFSPPRNAYIAGMIVSKNQYIILGEFSTIENAQLACEKHKDKPQ